MKKGAGILFTNGNKILLLKRATGDHSGTWAIPGGKAHNNEKSHENAIREIKEEIGFVKGKKFDQYCNNEFTTFLYRVKTIFKPNLNKEHNDYSWVEINNILDKNLHPKFKEVWPIYASKIKKIRPGSFKEWMLFR